jgi:hypothetical protein
MPSFSLDKKSVGWKRENYVVRSFITLRSFPGNDRAIKSVTMM